MRRYRFDERVLGVRLSNWGQLNGPNPATCRPTQKAERLLIDRVLTARAARVTGINLQVRLPKLTLPQLPPLASMAQLADLKRKWGAK